MKTEEINENCGKNQGGALPITHILVVKCPIVPNLILS